MADKQDTTTLQTEPESEEIHSTEKSGWLLKRNKISSTWKKKWFSLKDRTVFYGDGPDDTPKSIALDQCEITACEVKGRTNTFSLKPKETQRKYFIHAETETELQEWMQAICLAKSLGQKNSEGSQACVLQ